MSDVEDIAAGCARKRRYDTEQQARDVALACWRQRRVNLRAYPCPKCGGFHLTHQRAEQVMRPGWRPPAPSREQRARERRRRKHRRGRN